MAIQLTAPSPVDPLVTGRLDTLRCWATVLGEDEQGRRLTVSPELAGVVVYAQGPMDRQALLGRLADSVSAEWTRPSERELRLTRTRETEQRLRLEHRRLVDASIQQALQGQPGLREARGQAEAVARRLVAQADGTVRGPAHELLADLVRALGSESLAELPMFESVYFSTLRGAGTRRFPAAAGPVFAEYRGLLREIARHMALQGAPQGRVLERIRELQTRPDLATTFVLRAYRRPFVLDFSLWVFDPEGREMDRVSFQQMPIREAAESVGSAPAGPVELPAASRTLLQLWHADRVSPEEGAQALELLLRMSDPLELQAVPLLRAWVERTGSPMVVALPDWLVPRLAAAQPQDLRSFAQALAQSGVLVETREGVIVGRLARPLLAPMSNLSRAEWRRFVERLRAGSPMAVRARGLLGVTDELTFQAHNREFVEWTEAFVHKALGRPSFFMDGNMLLLIGHLSDFEWDSLLRGETRLLGVNSDRRRWAFGLSLVAEPTGETPRTDIESVPPWRLPHGVPRDAALAVAMEESVLVHPERFPVRGGIDMWVNTHLRHGGSTTLESFESFLGAGDLFTQQHLTIRLVYDPHLQIFRMLHSGQPERVAEDVTVSAWPAEYRARTEEYLRAIATARQDWGQGTAPPTRTP